MYRSLDRLKSPAFLRSSVLWRRHGTSASSRDRLVEEKAHSDNRTVSFGMKIHLNLCKAHLCCPPLQTKLGAALRGVHALLILRQ
jgi:hypothetical protein